MPFDSRSIQAPTTVIVLVICPMVFVEPFVRHQRLVGHIRMTHQIRGRVGSRIGCGRRATRIGNVKVIEQVRLRLLRVGQIPIVALVRTLSETAAIAGIELTAPAVKNAIAAPALAAARPAAGRTDGARTRGRTQRQSHTAKRNPKT